MSFYNDYQIGRRGEGLVARAMTAKGHKIEDVSMNPTYQLKDIDMILTDKSGRSTTLEVKNDIKSNETGNVFVEESNYNNVSRNFKGWFYYCEAMYIAFVQENLGKAHIIHHDDLNELIKHNYFPYVNANGGVSRGWCVPIKKLQQLNSYFCLEVEKL